LSAIISILNQQKKQSSLNHPSRLYFNTTLGWLALDRAWRLVGHGTPKKLVSGTSLGASTQSTAGIACVSSSRGLPQGRPF